MSLKNFLRGPGPQQKSEHHLGYDAGRRRELLPENATEQFRRGWVKGDSAADEAANGHQAWGQCD